VKLKYRVSLIKQNYTLASEQASELIINFKKEKEKEIKKNGKLPFLATSGIEPEAGLEPATLRCSVLRATR